MTYKNILVAFDGSDLSFLAYDKARQLAYDTGANLDIISVIDNHILKDISSLDTDYVHQIRDGVNNELSKLVNNAQEKGVKSVHQFIELGNPKTIISKDNFADQHDLIVLGATGMSKVEKIFIGSVTEYILNNAQCNCLVVKR
ncbi:universal stress protein [Xylocopilactobacillus apicola]|uniref:Universal stress protein n=1 Tax=Xylocopilactobacillus apicola TaxID=2932184 RepID=A0AAU9D7C4_9LACO|nr:universal stress protein [Xylocopilactobacillus apicola]BDR58286.1 universal stress protein [Xylocopilactobacillus apicola]